MPLLVVLSLFHSKISIAHFSATSTNFPEGEYPVVMSDFRCAKLSFVADDDHELHDWVHFTAGAADHCAIENNGACSFLKVPKYRAILR